VASLFDEASRARRPVQDVAEAFALRRFADVKRLAERDSWQRRSIEVALEAFREGWLPNRLVRRLSVGYFRRRVG
jgi:hypothetical protein